MKYRKPELVKVNLRVRETAFAKCKSDTSGDFGPNWLDPEMGCNGGGGEPECSSVAS